jgi:unsaturated rhamnogalacturonyl hydrolase
VFRFEATEETNCPYAKWREFAGDNIVVGYAVGYYDTRMSALPRQRVSQAFAVRVAAVALLILTLALPAAAQTNYFTDWPAGTSPAEVGKRVAEHFVISPHADPKHIVYQEVCTWYGALTFAQLSGDKGLSAKLIQRFDPLMTPEGAHLVGQDRHVDFTVFGTVPLEIYLQTQTHIKDSKYLDLGKSFADRQWENPTPDGLTRETRFWIDDMYMITTVQVQAFRATGDAKYLDRAALEMTAYLDRLQQPNGLFFHAPDAPFYWGRGNGWVAAGMTELLRALPADHPRRARILAAYRKMMQALLSFQGKDGMWRQLVDHPEAWPETSSTGMFTFALITGVKNGWLDPATYGPAARKGWLALVGYIDQNADVTSVCEGTGKKNDLDYYLARARRTGDFHGQAPVLWCASALLR